MHLPELKLLEKHIQPSTVAPRLQPYTSLLHSIWHIYFRIVSLKEWGKAHSNLYKKHLETLYLLVLGTK